MRNRLASIGLVASILAYAGTALTCLIGKNFTLISSGSGLFFLITRGSSRDEGVKLIGGLFLLTILLWLIGLVAGGLSLFATHGGDSASSQTASAKKAWMAIRLGMLHPLLFLLLIQIGYGRDPVCMGWIYLIATLEGITVLLFLVWRYAGTIMPIMSNDSRSSGSSVVGPTAARAKVERPTMQKSSNALGKASIWASIIGVVLPAALFILGITLANSPSAYEVMSHLGFFDNTRLVWGVAALVLSVILELAAFCCGIAARRTATGRAGLVISGAVLLLYLAVGVIVLLLLEWSSHMHFN
jgi:hypothetical protein